ncbi:glycoside hydrolase family 115 protein [Hortaea werneckii]|nr:glycoside hydrolase family 115 protein [Hortaea werneckii]KAI7721062.1 glycoside hydrolase family 115 protein [Hortaea werneckii]
MLLCGGGFALLLASGAAALLQDNLVSFTKTSDSAIPIHNAAIAYAPDDPIGVHIAAESLVDDFQGITGTRPLALTVDGTKWNSSEESSLDTVILIATANSKVVKDLVGRGLFDDAEIEGKWEVYKTTVITGTPLPGVDSLLLIAGSDKRGAIFGAYTLAEQCGQSPFHWWLDTSTKKHSEIYALPNITVSKEPAVKYRGLFINDEAPATTGWWSIQHGVDNKKLGTDYYKHVFDLLLRLRANFIWPAMWASFVPPPGNIFFTDDPENQILADQYGIVVSTSHHEPMQRATNEWNASETGPWDWTANKQNVTDFMREGIARAVGNETYFTMGMRGPSDSAIEDDDPIEVLRDVFDAQRDMLGDFYENVTAVPQVWTLYKEVQTYYSQGLIPPDDMTLMFSDDNWGNIQRFPLQNETARAGGIGLYFHLEYVGVPKSYKWQNTNNLAKVLKDLYHAHQRGVEQIWVINVADIKPMELPFGFIMDYAFDPVSISFESIPQYLQLFATREFGLRYAEEIAAVLMEHSRLIGRRKFESITPTTYSYLNYHEADRVISEWEKLAAETERIASSLPAEYQASFFHLVGYPVGSGANYHKVVLGQGRNRQYAIERRNTANVLAQSVLKDFEIDFDYEEEYDNIADGKWKGLLAQPRFDSGTSDSWKQSSRDVLMNLSYVQLRQNMDYEFGPLGIYAEGSESAMLQGLICASIDESAPTRGGLAPVLPTLDRYGPQTRTVEMFHRGDYRTPINWTITNDYDWLKIEPMAGQVSHAQSQQTVAVSVDWDNAPADVNDTMNVTIRWDAQPYFDILQVPVRNSQAPANFHGFPQAADGISIEGPHFQRQQTVSDGSVAFETIPYLGTRSTSGAIALRPYAVAREPSFDPRSTYVEYDIFLFDTSPGLNATVYITPGLDTDPNLPMKYSLSLDGAEANFTRLLEEPEVAGDLPDGWEDEVANAVWTRTVSLGPVEPGKHTLRWSVNSPEVYLEKLVLAVDAEVRESYLGPPESRRT